MEWRAFRHGQETYDLCHLDPKTITYVQEAKGNKPERTYTVEVIFSLHCFTRGLKAGEGCDPALYYSDDRETRVFDFQRYQLSKRLPALVEGLSKRKCYHSGKGNFFTVELVDEQARSRVEYEIYFTASRASKKGIVNLYVQSAYVRDREHQNRPHRKPIGFHIILYNVLNGIEIKVPR